MSDSMQTIARTCTVRCMKCFRQAVLQPTREGEGKVEYHLHREAISMVLILRPSLSATFRDICVRNTSRRGDHNTTSASVASTLCRTARQRILMARFAMAVESNKETTADWNYSLRVGALFKHAGCRRAIIKSDGLLTTVCASRSEAP